MHNYKTLPQLEPFGPYPGRGGKVIIYTPLPEGPGAHHPRLLEDDGAHVQEQTPPRLKEDKETTNQGTHESIIKTFEY